MNCAYSGQNIDPVYDPVRQAPDGKMVLVQFYSLYVSRLRAAAGEDVPALPGPSPDDRAKEKAEVRTRAVEHHLVREWEIEEFDRWFEEAWASDPQAVRDMVEQQIAQKAQEEADRLAAEVARLAAEEAEKVAREEAEKVAKEAAETEGKKGRRSRHSDS